LAEPWEDRTARMAPHALWARREDYGPEVEVPEPAVFLSAGIDVQVNRFELLVLGWGPGGERWVVDWREVPGDPRRPESFQALRDATSRARIGGGCSPPRASPGARGIPSSASRSTRATRATGAVPCASIR
jgi:hypothetical protein